MCVVHDRSFPLQNYNLSSVNIDVGTLLQRKAVDNSECLL